MADRIPHTAARSSAAPQPTPEPPSLPSPRDEPYRGVLTLEIDATDVERGIFQGRQTIPVAEPGPMTLLYPKWMPGYHAPQNPLELFGGLEIFADGERLDWRRDPVEVYAFHLTPPEGCHALDIRFQFLSPTASSQGDVVVTPDLLLLHWGRMLLYPAGYFSRRITVRASVVLPPQWSMATALETDLKEGDVVTFAPTPLDVLVDTPLMAGLHHASIPAGGDESVRFEIFAHAPEALDVTPEQIALHSELVGEALSLFGSRHFDRYRFLIALSDELGGGGVEHHRSAEIILSPTYFTDWARHLPSRDVFGHEFTHSWNGKFRRGADSWTPSFERPIRNSLMWLYEGQTQYWGHVLAARSGLWPVASAREALAKVAATYDVRPGGLWRPMSDTTGDPVITQRAPLPWPSWQRNEDYYSQGQLLWLAVDTRLRELTQDRRSLDDFAAAFFGVDDGSMTTRTYTFTDVVQALGEIAAFDWAGWLRREIDAREPGAPLEGLERGGYRLVYRPHRTEFCRLYDALNDQFDMRFSTGLTITDDGTVQEVLWGSPAFEAGITAGSQIKSVDGADYAPSAISAAVNRAQDGRPIGLRLKVRGRTRDAMLRYDGGHRFPHLEPIEGARPRLDEILAPRRTS